MKRLVSAVILSLVAAVVLFAAFHYMRAQGETSNDMFSAPQASSTSKTDDSSSKPVPHTLLTTYFTQGDRGGAAETAYEALPVDNPTTFKCRWPGCTLEIEQSMQVNGSSADNEWALLIYVDGSPSFSYSPWVGEVPSDGSYVLATSNQSIPVTPGKHTVQSYVGSKYGLALWNYHINYRVYAP